MHKPRRVQGLAGADRLVRGGNNLLDAEGRELHFRPPRIAAALGPFGLAFFSQVNPALKSALGKL